MKIRSENDLYLHRHFIEQLVDAFYNSPWKSNLNHKSSIFWSDDLRNIPGITCNHPPAIRKTKLINGSNPTRPAVCAARRTKRGEENLAPAAILAQLHTEDQKSQHEKFTGESCSRKGTGDWSPLATRPKSHSSGRRKIGNWIQGKSTKEQEN
jgi:hypothetical protein